MSKSRKDGRRLVLKFTGEESPVLDEVRFRPRESAAFKILTRCGTVNSFRWDKFPQAFSLFFLSYLIAAKAENSAPFQFAGKRHKSAAATLGDGIHQTTTTFHALFECRLRGVFGGDNDHGKANRDRRIWLRQADYLPSDCVEVFWEPSGETPLSQVDDLRRLAQGIRSQTKWNELTFELPSRPPAVATNHPAAPRVEPSGASAVVPPTPTEESIPAPIKKLLLDHLTGVGFADWLGNPDDQNRALNNAKEWLKASPDDVYVRGMVLWSVLNTGTIAEMVGVLQDVARWLASARAVPSSSRFDSETWRAPIEARIDQINRNAVAQPRFERYHLEDTLARAALLRWLRFQGAGSKLSREFTSLGQDLEGQLVIKRLLESTQSQRGDDWVSTAAQLASRWTGVERNFGLARLCLIWFTGRGRQRDSMLSTIEESTYWLERYPNQTFVRWATLFLAGLCREESSLVRHTIVSLIDASAKWLETEAAADDRLVRMGYLWLVGDRGTEPQIQKAIAHSENWLKAHEEDSFVRVVYLLFLVGRKRAREQRRKPIAEARAWLRKHADEYGLTDLALRLCESAPDPGS